jgi:hypothetical protein
MQSTPLTHPNESCTDTEGFLTFMQWESSAHSPCLDLELNPEFKCLLHILCANPLFISILWPLYVSFLPEAES